MRPRDVWFVLVFLGGWSLAGMTTAGATPPLERKAKALGLPATDCTYCHAFSMEHMNKKALETRVAPMNCFACHGRELPRRGSALFNERGRWLLAERGRRQVKEVDVGWLKEYVPSPAHAPAAAPRH
jgi:hypothetical protein